MTAAFSVLDYAFLALAAGSTLFFVLRVVLMFIGADLDTDVDMDTDISPDDMDAGNASDAGFQLLSINSVTAFFMMFGWTGIACTQQFHLSSIIAIPAGTGVGTGALYIAALIFHLAKKLQSSGSDFHTEKLIGKRGTVYLSIPAGKTGKIQITLDGDMTREYEATADEDIRTNEQVVVAELVQPGLVRVKRWKSTI